MMAAVEKLQQQVLDVDSTCLIAALPDIEDRGDFTW